MNSPDKNLDRLIRSAAQVNEEGPAAPPFGFETRVVSLWRSGINPVNGLNSLLRRVVLLSAAVMVVSTAAAVRELQQNSEVGDSVMNEFAIADSAIQQEFSK
jgi:hypothetical protein